MLAISDVSICNSALAKLGADRITSLEQDTKIARLCNERYPFVRNEVLRAYPWNFAKKRVSLSADATAPSFGWAYRFVIPSDCVRVLREDFVDVEYTIEGRYILSDDSSFNLLYVFEETNAGNYDYMFSEMLAMRLAADIAYAVVQSNTLMATMMTAYQELLRNARFVSAAEKTPEGPVADNWINMRF